MQTVVRILILSVAIALAGCALTPAPGPVTAPDMKDGDNPLFFEAETAFDNGYYEMALAQYQLFLKNAGDAAQIDKALFKIGKIYRLTGQNNEALKAFSRLTSEFPDSDQVPGAMAETMGILFEQGNYEAVIDHGRKYTQSTDKTDMLATIYTMIADAYEAMDARTDAALFRYRAMINAADENEAALAWEKLRKNTEALSTDEIETLVGQVTDRRALGYLLYRLGITMIMEEKYDDAVTILDTFVDQFPDHEDHQDALDMLSSLEERSRFTPFTIGCVLPLSGAYGLFGRRALDGIEFALSRIGETGDAIPFQIIVKDSRSSARNTIDAIEALDKQKVGTILGPMAESETAAQVAQQRGIPIVVFTQKEEVVDNGPYVFRNFITPRMQVRALVFFAIDQLGVNRFAILYPKEHYGDRFMNLFWDQVIEQGREVTGVEAYDPHMTDFADPIKKLAGLYYPIPRDLAANSLLKPEPFSPFDQEGDGSKPERTVLNLALEDALIGIPLGRDALDRIIHRKTSREDTWNPVVDFDAVFIPDAPKKAGLVIPQLAYYDIRDVYLLGTNLWNSQTLLDMSGDYMQSTYVVDGFFAKSENSNVKAFVDAFTEVYNRPPGIIEAVAFDSTLMVFDSMRQHATDSRREIQKALARIKDYAGVSGNTGFAPNGEAQKTMTMLRIEKGNFVEANPSPQPEPTPVVDEAVQE